MKSLTPELTARLNGWVASPHPIHRFVRVNFAHSGALWRRYSDYPSDISVDGHSYLAAFGLVSVGQTTISSGEGRSSFTFQVYDDDEFLDGVATTGIYRGFDVRCDVHFAGTAPEIASLAYRDVLYAGALDGIAIARQDSGKFLATLTCSSPFASLDEMRGRMGSKDDQRTILANDSSMDEAISSPNQSSVKWGERV